MSAPIFPLADRSELEAAADAIGEKAADIALMVEGIIAQRPCPKPRAHVVSLDLDPLPRLYAAGYREQAPLDL
jgi:hypothetical protein